MPRFDLSQYEPVEDRIRRFYADHPEGRIYTKIVHKGTAESGIVMQWAVKATVLAEDPEGVVTVVADGHAEEIVGSTNVNKTSALENCETSAIGRALANYGYAPKGARPSREEMVKASRPAPDDAITAAIAGCDTVDDLMALVPEIKQTPDPSVYHAPFQKRQRELA